VVGDNDTFVEPALEPPSRFQVHGTTIAINVPQTSGEATSTTWVAAMIRGPSGSGKSDLALRCLAQHLTPFFPLATQRYGVHLVADDRTELTVNHHAPTTTIAARAPATIAGLLEIRGLGIVAVPHIATARLVLIVDLVVTAVPRYPTHTVVNVGTLPPDACLPQLQIAPFEAASPLKLLLALLRTALSGSPVGADAAKHHYVPEGQ
jgi:HPr kinase/phosphorylase